MQGLLAWILVSAALHKTLATDDYRKLILSWQLSSTLPAKALVKGLAATEFLVGSALIFPQSAGYAAYMATVIFAVYGALMLSRILSLDEMPDCGCGGLQRRYPLSALLVVRNALLALAAVWCASHPLMPRDLISVRWWGLAVLLIVLWYTAVMIIDALRDPDDD